MTTSVSGSVAVTGDGTSATVGDLGPNLRAPPQGPSSG